MTRKPLRKEVLYEIDRRSMHTHTFPRGKVCTLLPHDGNAAVLQQSTLAFGGKKQ